jgi:hypothetical protein
MVGAANPSMRDNMPTRTNAESILYRSAKARAARSNSSVWTTALGVAAAVWFFCPSTLNLPGRRFVDAPIDIGPKKATQAQKERSNRYRSSEILLNALQNDDVATRRGEIIFHQKLSQLD